MDRSPGSCCCLSQALFIASLAYRKSCLSNVDLFRRDDLDLRRRRHAFHGDAAERLHVLGGAMRNKRLGVFPFPAEPHLWRSGDAFFQVNAAMSAPFSGFLEACGRATL